MRIISVAALVLSAAPAFAQEAPLKQVYDCAAVADGQQRLACYDAAVGRLKQAEAGGDVSVVSREQLAKVDRENFGLAVAPPVTESVARAASTAPAAVARVETPDRVTLQAKAIDKNRDGTLIIVTENGQVWRQVDSIKLPKLGDGPWTLEIRKGAIGSFLMNINGATAIRVKRIS